jgi:NADH-quinone oxidoreductase subunit L
MFILVTHAFFKALLFLSAGSVMHATDGVIDVRRLGGLRHKMPQTYITFLIGAMALAGIPLMSGFWAKDAVLASIVAEEYFLVFIVGAATALLTAIYSFRAVFLTFNGEPRDAHIYEHAHENKLIMTAPLWILAVLSIVAGLLNLPWVLTLEHFLEPAVGEEEKILVIIELFVMALSTVISLFGLVYAWARYIRKEQWPVTLANLFGWMRPALDNLWYVDRVYNFLIVRPLKAVAGWFAGFFDPKIVDGAVNGVGAVTLDVGEFVRRIQNGAIPTYAVSILLGAVAVLLYFLFIG